MAYEILSESYGRRLPKITATAESADDLTSLGTDYAEGSICTISDKTYTLDKVQGWIEAGSGGGGGGGGALLVHADNETMALDKTWQEIDNAKPLVYLDYIEGWMLPLVQSVYDEAEGVYGLSFWNYLDDTTPVLSFITDTADGYPVYATDD